MKYVKSISALTGFVLFVFALILLRYIPFSDYFHEQQVAEQIRNAGGRVGWEGMWIEGAVLPAEAISDDMVEGLNSLSRFSYLSVESVNADSSKEYIGRINRIKGLSSLGINDNTLTDEDILFLSGNKTLRTIDLTSTNLSDDSLKNLASFPKLKEINIYNASHFTDKSIEYLSAFPELETVRLYTPRLYPPDSSGNEITNEAVEEFLRKRPTIRLGWSKRYLIEDQI